jgi:hypothetical protein
MINAHQFMVFMKAWSTTGKTSTYLDPQKIERADPNDVYNVVLVLVNQKQPVLKEMVDRLTTPQKLWLNSMGYLYWTSGAQFIFLCTAENQHVIRQTVSNKTFKTEVIGAALYGIEEFYKTDSNVEARRDGPTTIFVKRTPSTGPAEFFTVKITASN